MAVINHTHCVVGLCVLLLESVLQIMFCLFITIMNGFLTTLPSQWHVILQQSAGMQLRCNIHYYVTAPAWNMWLPESELLLRPSRASWKRVWSLIVKYNTVQKSPLMRVILSDNRLIHDHKCTSIPCRGSISWTYIHHRNRGPYIRVKHISIKDGEW